MTLSPAQLIEAALAARAFSYSPYSGYRVGAALLGADGRVFTGCNVENASYPVTCCAERTALFQAVSQGCTKFSAIAIVGGPKGENAPLSGYASPCGMCRQALAEFGGDITVFVARSGADYREFPLAQLLPHSFSL